MLKTCEWCYQELPERAGFYIKGHFICGECKEYNNINFEALKVEV